MLAAAALPAASAPACGCGVMIPSDPSVRAEGMQVDEWSIVRWDGRREDLTMRLESSVAFDSAALIMPLPAEADFALGHDAVFDEMAERTEPRVETRTRYTVFGEGAGDEDDTDGAGAPVAAGDGAVQVVGSEDLGPLRVVTLRGDDGRLVETWLEDHGFEAPDGLALAVQPYLDRGWVIAAVRLRSARGGALRELQPLVIRFVTDRAVYPMMGGLGAPSGAVARVDVVAPHPVAARGRPGGDVAADDAGSQGRIFAGTMPGDRYLSSFQFVSAEEIEGGDAEFVPAPRSDYRQVRLVYEEVDITGWVVGAGAALLAGLALLVVHLRRRRRA